MPQPVFKPLRVCDQDYEKKTQLHGYPPITRHALAVKQAHLENAHVLTCLMAVTVMTKKRGSPLVIGEVGVSIINCGGERVSG